MNNLKISWPEFWTQLERARHADHVFPDVGIVDMTIGLFAYGDEGIVWRDRSATWIPRRRSIPLTGDLAHDLTQIANALAEMLTYLEHPTVIDNPTRKGVTQQ